ncbi:MAG: hypothetical protein HQK52_01740 [Oligoflexia bacterium]|nr:hypothetical protein [Oligoflexia bacterium]
MIEANMAFSKDYCDFQSSRSLLRRVIRRVYINGIAKVVRGDAIDFGCGVGVFLKKLSKKSIGLEVNSCAVDFCNKQGLTVSHYNPVDDNYSLGNIRANQYGTFLMIHVLEHISGSREVMEKIMGTCARLGIRRLIFVVPCFKGFLSDKTHCEFIDLDFFRSFDSTYGYKISEKRYFPFNNSRIGRYFKYNELWAIYDRKMEEQRVVD